MSWKYVFNTEVSAEKWWGVIGEANNFAKEAGYSFFTWNGIVWNVDGEPTNLFVEDLF
jgi:hypothetical protein